MSSFSRRQFIRTAALTGAATSVASAQFFPAGLLVTGSPPAQPVTPAVRLAFAGVGARGYQYLRHALDCRDIAITAICDPNHEAISQASALVRQAGRKAPALYDTGNEAFRQMLQRDDIDGVIIATPSMWQVPIALATMQAGKYAGVDASLSPSLQEAWALVDTFEQIGAPCMFLEPVCYRRDALAILNMIRQGLFGRMTYAHCGYQHTIDQRPVERTSAVYPMHGLGPVAHWFDINRGNRFTQLTSLVTKSRGLFQRTIETNGMARSGTQINASLSDVITTTLQCANGEHVVVIHDTATPRPYSPGFQAQGTRGMWMSAQDMICLNDLSGDTGTNPRNWEAFSSYQETYDHPLWKRHYTDGFTPQPAVQDDMDFRVLRAFVESVKTQTAPPIDVYDAAVWSAIDGLAAESIAHGGKPITIPDFTRGKWQTNKLIFGLTDIG